jgi:hypothetical protein
MRLSTSHWMTYTFARRCIILVILIITFSMAQLQMEHPEWVNKLLDDDMSQEEDAPPSKKNVDQKAFDAILAKELNQLSFQQRNAVLEELHGVDAVIEETPEFVQDKLNALQEEISKILKKDAYERAEQVNRNYVHDPKFRLMFLRADYFCPKEAAARLVWFMEKKLHFFGPDSLGRPVMLKDLDKDDQEALQAGHLQLLPARDRAGRVVIGDFQNLFPRCYKRGVNQVSDMGHQQLP